MEHNINDILGQMEEQPSSACWDRLSSRLDAAMPQQMQQSVSANTPAAAHKLHGLSAAWKAVAAAAGVVAVSAAAATVYLLNRDNTPPPRSIESGNAAALHDSLAEEHGDTVSVVAATSANINEVHDATTAPAFASPATPFTAMRNQPKTKQIQTDKSETMAATATSSIAPAPALSPTAPVLLCPLQPVLLPTGAADTPMPTAHDLEPTGEPEHQHTEGEVFPLEIPNVFTPNGDGYNDYFEIKGLEHCTNCQVTIRNQAGNIVFKSGNYNNNWGGDDCLDGVYHYQITYKMAGDDAHTVMGIVHILRR